MFMQRRGIRAFIFIDIFAIYSIILSIKYFLRFRFSNSDFLVILYLTISLFSIFLFFQRNNPASLLSYLYGVHHLVFPIFLYFVVRLLDSDSQKCLLEYICYMHIFLVGVGILLFYWRPGFYNDYISNLLIDVGVDKFRVFLRMNSYFGSRVIGAVAGITILLLTYLGFGSNLSILTVILMITGALLAQQRGGFIVTSIAIVYYFFSRPQFKKVIIFSLVIIGLLFLFKNITDKYEYVGFYAMDRYEKLGSALSERFYQNHVRGWDYFKEYPFGLGLGATAYRAYDLNPKGTIPDANFIRILADLGIFGIINFILILVFSIINATKKQNPFLWILLINTYCILALGTNVFDTYYLSQLFWVLLGIVNTKESNQFQNSKSVLANNLVRS